MAGPCVLCVLVATALAVISGEDLQKTKVFVLPVEPSLFNWTNGYSQNGYWYRAALINAPDLPPWISYHFSKRHRKGFIYGVPPVDANNVQVEVVGLNREDYETRKTIIALNITEKMDPAKYEISLKIDNLNLEDMFDPHRLFNLLRIFTTVLWPDSAENLYMTNLVSAVKLGARLPLSPKDGEGVVVHLGSSTKFSDTLEHLEQEVMPLKKINPCPRDFKRSSVDRHFRPNGFVIDWCSFKLIKLDGEATLNKAQYLEPAQDDYEPAGPVELVRREEIPRRDYSIEIISTLIVPILSLLALMAFLTVILCVQHENIYDPESDHFFDSIFEIFRKYRDKKNIDNGIGPVKCEPIQYTQCTLRDGNPNCDGSPRLSESSSRPSPPPYSATKKIPIDS